MAKKRRRRKKKITAGNLIKKAGGAFALLLGITLAGWAIYNILQGKIQTEGKNMIGGALVSMTLITVGYKWLMDKEVR